MTTTALDSPVSVLVITTGPFGFMAARIDVDSWSWRRPSALDSPGAQHIDRVVGQVAAGVPGRDPAVRLEAAALLAEILDGRSK